MDEEESIPELCSEFVKSRLDIQTLLDQFRCRVCLDPFVDPVMSVVCSHNFCSICVRKYLIYKQQCPECLVSLHEKELKPNRTVKEILNVLTKVTLPKIEKLLKKHQGGGEQIADERENIRSEPEKLPSRNNLHALSPTPSPEKEPMKPSQSCDVEMKKNQVLCPVCQVFISDRNINAHLDRCLAEQSNPEVVREQLEVSKPKRNAMKPMKKVVYHLLKDSQLKQMCKEIGLETKGDRRTLTSRHQRYVALWNSQCESENPMSPVEIKMKVDREEKLEKKESLKANSMRSASLIYDRNTDPKIIEQNQKKYLGENKNQFNELIMKVKEKQRLEKERKEKEKVVADKEDEKKLSSKDEDSSHSEAPSERILENEGSDRDEDDRISEAPSESILDDDFEDNTSFNPQDLLEVNMGSNLSKTISNESLDIFESPISKRSSPTPNSSSDNFVVSGQTSQNESQTSKFPVVSQKKEELKTKSKFISPPLYVTPNKRPGSHQLTPNSEKKLRQTGISQGFSSQTSGRSSRKDPCPVCKQMVPSLHLNAHLDRCLNQGQKRKSNNNDDDDFVADHQSQKSLSASGRKKFKESTFNAEKENSLVVIDDDLDDDIVEIDEEEEVAVVKKTKGKGLKNGKSAAKKSSRRLAELQKS